MRSEPGTRSIQLGAILLFGSACIVSWSYPPKARWIPLIIATTGLLIALVDFFIPVQKKEDEKEACNALDVSPRRELVVWLWIGILFLLVVSVGLIVGSAAFLAIFLKFFWKEKWTATILVSVVTGACIYLLFNKAFQMQLYRGIFFE